MQRVSESLAGRIAIIKLSGLACDAHNSCQHCEGMDGYSGGKRQIKNTGLVCCLTGWHKAKAASRGAMAGNLLENYTIRGGRQAFSCN